MARLRRKPPVIVFGILFRYPLAGVTYQFLHYLIGLRRLGYDPYYIEDSGRGVYDPRTQRRSPDASGNVAAVAPVLEAHGFGDRWAFRGDYPGGRCYGMDEEQILRLYRDADALLNVTGAQEIRDEHLACRRRIYVESDPFPRRSGGPGRRRGTIAALAAHDTHFSFGENLGSGGLRRARSNAVPLAADPPAGGARPVEHRPHAPARDSLHHDHDVAQQGEGRRVTAGERTTGRRTASSRSSSTCRGDAACRSSWRHGVDDDVQRSAAGARLAAGRLGRRLARRRSLPRLHPALAGRIHRRPRPVRAPAHRLVQRPQRLLSGRRPAGHHAGDRLQQVPADGAGACSASRRWTTSSPPWTRSRATTQATAGRRVRSRAEYFAAEKVVGSLMRRAELM